MSGYGDVEIKSNSKLAMQKLSQILFLNLQKNWQQNL